MSVYDRALLRGEQVEAVEQGVRTISGSPRRRSGAEAKARRLFFCETRDISYGWVPIERRYHGFLYIQGVFFSGATGTQPAAHDHNIIFSGATFQCVCM